MVMFNSVLLLIGTIGKAHKVCFFVTFTSTTKSLVFFQTWNLGVLQTFVHASCVFCSEQKRRKARGPNVEHSVAAD